ncbi:MAG: helix-turn-helix transcriptional regulator [Actinobacteria bacterium]|nr:helix-turn-helix transcriptional regulator [Actinomycetota bacterium]
MTDLVAPPAEHAAQPTSVVRSSADLVHLAEDLYERLFKVTLGMVTIGGGVTVLFSYLDPRQHAGIATIALGAGSSAAGAIALRHAHTLYVWLRFSAARQASPGLLGAILLVAHGPYAPMWFVALALVAVTAVVASIRLTLGIACLATVADIASTLIRGAPLVPGGDGRYVAAALGLIVNGAVARGLVELLARFMLRLHRVARDAQPPGAPARRVPNLAPAQRDRPRASATRPARDPNRLTARQLETVLLLRDGLRQQEIAQALGISARQVERLVTDARTRAGARTTSQLVAMLVESGLAPPGNSQVTADAVDAPATAPA